MQHHVMSTSNAARITLASLLQYAQEECGSYETYSCLEAKQGYTQRRAAEVGLIDEDEHSTGVRGRSLEEKGAVRQVLVRRQELHLNKSQNIPEQHSCR
eukprot:6205324-Pleurochrysis_carterae.AAC.1